MSCCLYSTVYIWYIHPWNFIYILAITSTCTKFNSLSILTPNSSDHYMSFWLLLLREDKKLNTTEPERCRVHDQSSVCVTCHPFKRWPEAEHHWAKWLKVQNQSSVCKCTRWSWTCHPPRFTPDHKQEVVNLDFQLCTTQLHSCKFLCWTGTSKFLAVVCFWSISF